MQTWFDAQIDKKSRTVSNRPGSPENLNLCLPKENFSSKEIIMIRDCNPFLMKTYINSTCNLEYKTELVSASPWDQKRSHLEK